MTETKESAVAAVVGLLDAVEDPAQRFEELGEVEVMLEVALKDVRRRISLELKASGITWREVGETMGGVSPQRAHQISEGK
ncbi:hypothetical protein HYE82_31330 [Streptomyces sp. BR123]|uniref:hypothetical protein n=1 Tax=Streptomyces sp. BR123 TaxID=2749828 RepID=UPI0015C42E56|nr:hypothetical protein [Streptomyces sp. BR123]NXY98794.1 hypothetical protein [Streptomyces sp. BR123]